MPHFSLIFTLLAMVSATGCTPAPAPASDSETSSPTEAASEPLPLALREWFQAANAECTRSGGVFSSSEDDGAYWQAGDFNGDGQPDFLVTRAALQCSDTMIFSGGTRGQAYEVLISTSDGHVLLDGGILAHDADVVQRQGRTVVLTPDPLDEEMLQYWAWDGSKLAVTGEVEGPDDRT